jgi:hypothetical protein
VKRIKHNAGYSKFISKWGITSGTFSKYYLRRGAIYDGQLEQLTIPWNVKLKNYIKRVFTAITKK